MDDEPARIGKAFRKHRRSFPIFHVGKYSLSVIDAQPLFLSRWAVALIFLFGRVTLTP